MAIEDLFDHTVQVHRPTEQPGAIGDVVEVFVPLAAPTRPNAAIVPPKLTFRDYGPGEEGAGDMAGFMAAGADVQSRDVLQVLVGPEAPVLLRVQSVTRPRGHHTELVLKPFIGVLS